MDETEGNMSTEDINNIDSPMSVKIKPKKSLVERELETNLTARVTSPVTGEGSNTSRYGRARRLKTAPDLETEKNIKPLKVDVSKQPQAYKMHASNSPISKESPKRTISVGSSIEDQIENIYNENISLSRFSSEEKMKTQSPAKKFNKIYIRKDLIQKPDTDTVLIKNMFSPNKSSSHLNNILERSSEKYSWNGHGKAVNGLPDNCSVVKTLDFDGKRKASPVAQNKKELKEKVGSPLAQSKNDIKEKLVSIAQSKNDIKEKLITIAQPIKKEVKDKPVSKNELFKLEASCECQVGDLAWARVGTYPFWPCIVTRDPFSDMFVKKKLFGRVERSVIHVTFFGDNGRRGWIVDNMLRKYHGRAEFEACREKFTPESKKKDPRFYAAHFVSEKKLALWNVSVEEAETLMKEPKRLRVDALYNMLEQARAAKTTPSKRDKGGKITRTDSDVSLSESLFDTLFSEDDGKSDDNRSKRARNKSLDVSEVVTACLDNMVARSGITQIQRQSHMDRWLQKAKSKTPEKIQPKLHVKVETEKRKDKARKKKEGKKLQKMRKNESLGSDTNLLPYQNEHDYSSVNYENHDINDSVNKNTDSASGLDSTLDTSTPVCDIGVTVKIENMSSSMEDCSQDDIITTVVNDDIVMTEPENVGKDDNDSQNGTSHKDFNTNKVENNNEHMDTNKEDENKMVEVKEELSLKTSNLTNTIEPRRSKRKRQTFEGLNNSISENKAKEPKLDLKNSKPRMDTTTPNETRKSNKKQESKSKAKKVAGNITPESNVLTVTNLEKETVLNSDVEQSELVSLNSDSKSVDHMDSITSETKIIDKNRPAITNVEKQIIQDSKIDQKETEHMLCETTPEVNAELIDAENTTLERNIPAASYSEEEIAENGKVGAKKLTSFNNEATPVVDIEPLNSENSSQPVELKVSITNCEEETFQHRKPESMECIPFSNKSTPMVVIDAENAVKETITPTVANLEEETSKNVEMESTDLTLFNSKSKPEVFIEPIDTDNTLKEIITPIVTNLEIETSKNAEHESTELTLFTSKSKAEVVIEPLNTENIVKEIITPTVKNLEIETSKSAEHESTELTSFTSKFKAVVVMEPLDTENTVKEIMTPTATKLVVETSKSAEHVSTELTLFTSKSKAVVVIEPLDTEKTVKEIMTPTVTNLEIETSKSAGHESTELTLFTSKSKAVVVIKPLDTEITAKKMTVTNLEKESSKNVKLESTEHTLFNSKSKPVVVIEPLKYENTATESCKPIVSNLEKESSSKSKLGPIGLISFHKSSKPVVVIEPLDMNGLETQFIIKGSKQSVLNKNNINKKETPRLSSDVVKNDDSNIFQDDVNVTEANSAVGADTVTPSQLIETEPKEAQGDISKEVHHETRKSLADSERMEVDDCASEVVDQEQANTTELAPHTEITGIRANIALIQTKAIQEPTQPSVVIGEETYLFDRTLSQDYDEVDGDYYDEYSHLPPVIVNEEAENAVLCHEIPSLQDSCKDKTSDFKGTKKIPSASDDSGSMIVESDSKLRRDCAFLDQESVQNDFVTVPLEDNKVPAVAGDVSSTVNEENNSNQVSQDNNDKCIFLDQSLKTADAQSANNIEKKRKSPRFSLNRTRNLTLKLSKVDNKIQTPKIIIENINTDSDKRALETASNNCTDNVMLIKNAGRLQERRDSKKFKNDPEFIKYMEIRQDALLDEQPDLTQDEIVTYLYQNWLYEERKKSEAKKIDDNEQSNLVKGFQELPKKTKKKSKVEKAAELNNIDIRDMLHKGNGKSLPDKSERQGETLTNHFEHKKAPCEAFNKNSMSQLNKDLQTVECNKKANIKLEVCGKEPVSINVNDRGISTRRSRRSKDTQETMKTMHELKEKAENKCVLETALINAKDTEESKTRRSQSSKEKTTNHIVNKDLDKCDIETDQMSSNDNVMFNVSTRLSKERQDTRKAMNEPEFIKYFERHQDALLDEQPDLTQDEIVTYLYQNWLYEEGNKSEIKKIEDNQQYELVKSQETTPHIKHHLYTLEISSTKANTDTGKYVIASNSSNSSKPSITEYNGSPGPTKEKLDTIQKMTRKCVLEIAPLKDSEMLVTKRSKQTSEKNYTNQVIGTEQEKCVKDLTLINYKDSETADNKRAGRERGKQDAKKATSEPEFIKYLEIHQDALLDDQPDLTQVEIVTYLYQNWLYEEGNKSEMKKIDENEQSNLVKDFNQLSAPQPKKIKKKSKTEKAPELKTLDIRDMLHKEDSKPVPDDFKIVRVKGPKEPYENNIPGHENATNGKIENATDKSEDTQIEKQNYIVNIKPAVMEKVSCLEENNTFGQVNNSDDTMETLKEAKKDEESPTNKTTKNPANLREVENLQKNISCQQANDKSVANPETIKISEDIEDMEFGVDELAVKENFEGAKESTHLKIIKGFIEFEENSSKAKTIEIDSETASIKSEESAVSITRKGRKEKDAKKSMDDPDFLKYLQARQDALIDEQPDLTQEEIVTYLYQTWFYEESTKSDVKKSDETEQSNLVKGLNREPLQQPKKIKKKSKVETEPAETVKSSDIKDFKVEKSEKVWKNADIRDMIQKPKRKATQSKPYYNEDDSDLEEEDLETFKIFDRNEQIEGEEIDEVELYFEQLTKPKPNVFKGYVRERVCEICYRTSNLVKCKSCHGTYHVECVNKEVEVTEVAGPTRGRKKKRGRKPKSYDPSLETGSQSDERSQDANNSEEINISLEDEAESHIVFDEDNFETLWESKIKEVQTDNQEEYLSDQEIDWGVEPGHCEIVDLKHKEKPINYSDYKCIKCLKYETPVCFVCQSNKSPKSLTEVRQKCQVAHCHRYYHLECLDHWPQTQFNSWEPSKTNKKQIDYIEALTCPRHVCHTCVSDDPRGCKTRFCGDKLARCVKCPATYHSYTKCLPAGTQILTGSQIICPRHYEHRPGKVPCHVNTGWCFICALGGTLICCEYCPTSFHAECLNIKPPEGSYMCEDCETGRLPLYGEMVWVKLGHYRWWPGIVLHPTEIPDNIQAVKHSQGEFVVRFFGQYDHYWVNRGRVFPFQEGDSGRISSQKSKIDAAFTTAMEHAQRACEILKKMEPNEEEDLDIASSLLPPHYVKLKVNKPAGGVVRRDIDANSLTQCDCDPNQPDPCGPYSHCLNRMLLTECGPLCRAGERCNNRAFERRLYPRLQAYRAPHRGWGLRTLDDIRQGQFVIEYVGELIDMEEFRRRMCRKHEIRDENFYFLTLDKERMIDAGPKGNLARFMNHCCEPNCETQKWTVLGDVRVGLFALYDIPANSEVTFNYNLECAGIEKKRCLCGAKRCSGYIGAKPKQLQEDKTNKSKHPTKRTYKKRKPVEEPIKPKPPKIKIKPIKPRELTEIEKDLLIIKCATNGMSSDSEGSRLSVEDKNPKALKRKRVSFSTDEMSGKKAKLAESDDA